MKLVGLAPAVLLIAQHKAISISELVHLYQQMGFGGAQLSQTDSSARASRVD
jgi:hypothetical protein